MGRCDLTISIPVQLFIGPEMVNDLVQLSEGKPRRCSGIVTNREDGRTVYSAGAVNQKKGNSDWKRGLVSKIFNSPAFPLDFRVFLPEHLIPKPKIPQTPRLPQAPTPKLQMISYDAEMMKDKRCYEKLSRGKQDKIRKEKKKNTKRKRTKEDVEIQQEMPNCELQSSMLSELPELRSVQPLQEERDMTSLFLNFPEEPEDWNYAGNPHYGMNIAEIIGIDPLDQQFSQQDRTSFNYD